MLLFTLLSHKIIFIFTLTIINIVISFFFFRKIYVCLKILYIFLDRNYIFSFYTFFSAPNFVSSFTQGDFVYFLFRETAVEYINCGKVSNKYVQRKTHTKSLQKKEQKKKISSFWLIRKKGALRILFSGYILTYFLMFI